MEELKKRYWASIHWALANWSVVLSGLAFYSGLNTLTLIIIARRADPIEYGQYLSSFALAAFFVIIPSFGIDAWLLTQHRENWGDTTALWASSIRTRALLLAPWFVGMFLLAVVLPHETYPPSILLPTIVGVAMDSLLLMSYATLRTHHKHKIVSLTQAAYSITLLGISLLLPLNDYYVTLFAVARTLLSLIFALILLAQLGSSWRRARSPLIPVRSVISNARPFLLAELASSVYVRADLTIVSLFLGPEGTSVYGPAITLLQAMFLAPRAIFYVVVPVLSKTYVGLREKFRERAFYQLGAQLLLGLLLSIILFAVAPWLITVIFTDDYADSAKILRILSPLPLLRSFNFAFAAILTSSDRQRYRTRAQIAAAIVNVGGNLIVIIPYGIIGVAIVYLLSEVVLGIGYLVILRDRIVKVWNL